MKQAITFQNRQLLENWRRFSTEEQTLTLPKRAMSRLLFDLYRAYGFDEQDYLGRYEDVRNAVRRGELESGLQHYCTSGFFEGRLANLQVFDQDYYVRRNADVWKALEKGELAGAYEHFVTTGVNEGRAPNQQADVLIAEWRELMK